MKHKAVKGAMFQSIGGIVQVAIRLIGSMILARLLTPDDFGIFALIVLVYGLLAQLKTFGAVQAIIARKNISQKQLSTAFFTNFAINIILFILLWLVASLIADIYDEQRLVDAMRVISFIFLFHAFSTVPSALLERRMQFHYVNIVGVTGAIVEVTLSVVLVYYYGFDYWALVWALVAGELYMTFLKILLAHWKPTLEFSRISFFFFIRYGSYLAGETTLIYFRQNLDYFIVGKMFGTASLGFYSFANRLPNIVYSKLLGPISGIFNPSMSKMKTKEEVTNAFLKFSKYNGYIAAPILISIFILAEPIILLLWGDQWHEAVVPMKILVLVAGINVLGLPLGSVFLRYNRADLLFKIGLIKLPISVGSILLFGYLYGLIGIIIGKVVAGFINYWISLLFLHQVINVNTIMVFKTLVQLIIAIFIATFIAILVYNNIKSLNYFIDIIIITPIIFLSFITTLRFFPNEWIEIKSIITLMKRKS